MPSAGVTRSPPIRIAAATATIRQRGNVQRRGGWSAPAGWSTSSQVFGAGLGGTPENVIPASHFILERSDQALEHGRDVLVIHRCTSVIAVLTFR